MQLRTLADFKRFLKTLGATVQITRHDWVHQPNPGFFDPRKVKRVQSNSVCFEMPGRSDGSWLDFKRASSYRFEGDLVTVALRDDETFDVVMQYRCWIE